MKSKISWKTGWQNTMHFHLHIILSSAKLKLRYRPIHTSLSTASLRQFSSVAAKWPTLPWLGWFATKGQYTDKTSIPMFCMPSAENSCCILCVYRTTEWLAGLRGTAAWGPRGMGSYGRGPTLCYYTTRWPVPHAKRWPCQIWSAENTSYICLGYDTSSSFEKKHFWKHIQILFLST